ncbi:hypothetical protein WR25_02738 [Diploscapter pachys]|uniref:Uncharacterized protein n=1 Tax=Diploscapter pachys TaxID=2018661 RepID=A0A2A2L267_9BILA|nr:hypothetical protein WR25_02738 [Diploscapter pachys]
MKDETSNLALEEISQTQSDEKITRQALGRNATLGDFYDATRDVFCPRNLFSDELPESSVRITPKKTIRCHYEIEGSTNEKCTNLGIGNELKISVLTGLVNFKGHEEFLKSNNQTNREYESIKRIDNANVTTLISEDAIKNTLNATHVVVAIQWGAIVLATLKCTNVKNEDKKELSAGLEGKLSALEIATSDEAKADLAWRNTKLSENYHYHFEFYIDSLLKGEKVPQNIEEAKSFMSKLPGLIEESDSGKGVPIWYELLPISSFKHCLGSVDSINRISRSIENDVLEDVVRIYEEMDQNLRDLRDLKDDLHEFSFCTTSNESQSIDNDLTMIQKSQMKMKKQLGETIVNIRSGKSDITKLNEVIEDYSESKIKRSCIEEIILRYRPVCDKIKYVKHLQENGVHYIGEGKVLENERSTHSQGECYVFFCQWTNPQGLKCNRRYFDTLINRKSLSCFLVDVDIHREIQNEEKLKAPDM